MIKILTFQEYEEQLNEEKEHLNEFANDNFSDELSNINILTVRLKDRLEVAQKEKLRKSLEKRSLNPNYYFNNDDWLDGMYGDREADVVMYVNCSCPVKTNSVGTIMNITNEEKENLTEFASNSKLLNAYSKLPDKVRSGIRSTKKEVKSTVINKDTGKVRKGALAAIGGSMLVPIPGAGALGFAGVKGYDKWKARRNNESYYFSEVDEGLVGKVAGKKVKDMTKDAIKNNVTSKLKQNTINSTKGENIQQNYQNKKQNILNKMKDIKGKFDNDETAQTFLPMATNFIPSLQKKPKQYGDITSYKKYSNLK